MKISTALVLTAVTMLLAACGKEPAPLSTLPPAQEAPKAAASQPSETSNAQPAKGSSNANGGSAGFDNTTSATTGGRATMRQSRPM